MAILTVAELAAIRQRMARQFVPVIWTKAQVNAAVQAVEDRLVASKAVIGADIETAAPGKFDAAQKKAIAAYAVLRYAVGEGAI